MFPVGTRLSDGMRLSEPWRCSLWNPAYEGQSRGSERYPVGSQVRDASPEVLNAFARDWHYHHPPEGIWPEACLGPVLPSQESSVRAG